MSAPALPIVEMINPPLDAPPVGAPPPSFDRIGLALARTVHTGFRNHGIAAQRIGDQVVLTTSGDAGPAYPARNASRVEVPFVPHQTAHIAGFDGHGRIMCNRAFADPKLSTTISVFPAIVDRSGRGEWAVSCVTNPPRPGPPGQMMLLDIERGRTIWATDVPGKHPWGNGSCVWGDIDRDGRREIVFGNCADTTCVDAMTGAIRWSFQDGVKTCHGRMALGDINGDGKAEIVFGSEYADAENDGLSSMFVLDANGALLHRRRNLMGDFASTATVLIESARRGKLDIAIAGQNLCWRTPRHVAAIHRFDDELGGVAPPIEAGVTRFAVDANHFAYGIQDYRDGGPLHSPISIVAASLSDGEIIWRTPVRRAWLCGDPCLADVDGDGEDELIVTTNYPSGYAHQPGTTPWSDLYILRRQSGEMLACMTLPDAAYMPIVIDADGDGQAEIVVPCHDGNVYFFRTPAKSSRTDCPVPQANFRRTGRIADTFG